MIDSQQLICMSTTIKNIVTVGFLFVVFAVCQQQFNLTIVTGLWNIGRHNFYSSQRSYEFYLSHFKQLLQYDCNMIIFGTQLEFNFTQQNRPPSLLKSKTLFVRKELADFQKYWHTRKVWQVIEKKRKTLSKLQALELMQTPQYGLKMYNPVVMSKHRLIYQASIIDPFFSEYLLWLDGGFTHLMNFQTLQKQFFRHMVGLYQPDWFMQTGQYGFNSLGLGFYNEGNRYSPSKQKIKTQVLGNWVGGRFQGASTAFHIYQNILRITFQRVDMNTDESVFILLAERYPFFFNSIKNSTAPAYYDLKVRVERHELPVREFNWDINLVRQYYCEKDSEFVGQIQVLKVIDLNEQSYFTRWTNLYAKTLTNRIIVLLSLLAIHIILCTYIKVSNKSY